MLYRVLADLAVISHLAFILFAVLGALLVFRWRRWAWIHVPTFAWAALISFAGWVCPLTPLENWLRYKGGEIAYRSGFIEHYILPVIYPDPTILTRRMQIILGLSLLFINLGIYGRIVRRIVKSPPTGRGFPERKSHS
jgi:hypothetical protein